MSGPKAAASLQCWHLTGDERAAAIDRLRAWVDMVLRPGYGHLAKKLGPCWEQHDLCLYTLDWLSEMHRLIYQPGEREWGILATQADWQTRFLPAALAQLDEETHSCDHLPGAGSDPWAGTP